MDSAASTGRGGRQRLAKVGQRGLAKAAAYALEQRDRELTGFAPIDPAGKMLVISCDPPFDEELTFERISKALRQMTEFVAEESHRSSGEDREAAVAG